MQTQSPPARRVPYGFFGAHTDRYSASTVENLDRELALMVASGVETLRVTFFWNQIQTFYAPRFPGAMHSVGEWIRPDAIVAAAAEAGLRILGTIWGAPSWATGGLRPGETSRFAFTAMGGVPEYSYDFANFMADLIERYGPEGTFWRDHPDVPAAPVRMWQPWQEPDRPAFMPQPFDSDYFVEMSHAAYDSIKKHDPDATVLGTGLGPACGESGDLMEQIYRSGYAGSCDVVGLHPFPADVTGLVKAVQINREVMDRYGEGHLPIVLSQVSFSSSLGKSRHRPLPNMTDEQGQADRLREAMRTLAERREELNLYGVYYHGWSGCDVEADAPRTPDPWLFTGLRRVEPTGEFVSKPALAAYREIALEFEGRTDN